MPSLNLIRSVEELLLRAKVKAPPVPVFRIADLLGLSVRIGPLPDDLSGFLLHRDNGPLVGINSLHSKARQTFTLAHECAHYMLHPSANFVDRGFFYFRDSRSASATDKREIEANQFAAALLMPERFLKAELRGQLVDLEDEERIRLLSKVFGVSLQALTFRLINLNLART